MRFLFILLVLCLTSCGWFSQVAWPAVVSCSVEPSTALIDGAIKALQEDGDTKVKMEALAKTYGAEMVICVVRELVSRTTTFAASREVESNQGLDFEAAQRGEDFLASIGHPSE